MDMCRCVYVQLRSEFIQFQSEQKRVERCGWDRGLEFQVTDVCRSSSLIRLQNPNYKQDQAQETNTRQVPKVRTGNEREREHGGKQREEQGLSIQETRWNYWD